MNVFFDENFADRIPHALEQLDAENHYFHVVDVGWGATKDVAWLSQLPVDEHNVVFTLDRGISRNPVERTAWRESGAVIFFLKRSWQDVAPWDVAAKIITRWEVFLRKAEKARPGTGFIVPVSGNKIETIDL